MYLNSNCLLVIYIKVAKISDYATVLPKNLLGGVVIKNFRNHKTQIIFICTKNIYLFRNRRSLQEKSRKNTTIF